MATEQEMDLPNLCRAVADASPMAMAGLGGPVHTLRYVNLAFCLLTGKSKDELIGTPFSGIAPCANECVVLLDRVAKTGLADSHTGQEHIHPLYWSFAMWPLLGANQSHLGIMVQITEATQFHDDAVAMNQALLLGSVRQHELTEAAEKLNTKLQAEMTERKRAEDELLKAGALQHAIFNSTNFSSIATDAHGVIQIFNVGAERMLGYTAAEVMNQITPADISDPREVIARAAALSLELGTQIEPGFEALVFKASRGIEDIYELTYIRKDGSRFSAVVSVTALRDAQNAIIGYLLIGTDNTARKQAEEALLRSEMLASAGRMAASIAHEINNPLAAVVNTLYLVRTTADLPEGAREYLDVADGELMRIAHIVRQTLGFYREFSAATSNSGSALMASVVDLLKAKIRASGAIVEQQCAEQLQVMGVSGELRQVLANLLANSLDSVDQGGRIVLRASASIDPDDGRRRFRITVADCGHGMGAATMKQIF
ncbi:MAG TPA: PAS domain S-box protein, partial [Edaphobacter sp.]|uniref:PAS domain-containing protein n=1 Tax=Edaphobacter sp. TaxID=1934404 RepID=UPI002CE23730